MHLSNNAWTEKNLVDFYAASVVELFGYSAVNYFVPINSVSAINTLVIHLRSTLDGKKV